MAETGTAAASFETVADALRERVLRYYDERGERLEGAAGENTLETNSGLVASRGAPLLAMLAAAGAPPVAGKRVVDLGCGFGALACFFAFHGAEVVALDPKADRLVVGRDIAAEFGLDITFRRGWMQSTRAGDAAFDFAVQNNSLCYIVPREARANALAETFRVLRPGGWMISRNPNRWSPRDQFTGLPLVNLARPETAVALARRLGHSRSRVRLTSPPEARRELRRAGFVDIRQAASPAARRGRPKLVAGYHHFVARRPETA